MAKVIAMVNRKGGVLKTTTSVNVGADLARRGKRVLAIDLDSQRAGLTKWMLKDGIPPGQLEIADALIDPKCTPQAIVKTGVPGVELIPGSARTADAEVQLQQKPAPDAVLRRVVRQIEGYDYIFLDCGPSLSRVVIAAMVAADEIILPMKAQGMSLDAAGELLDLLEEMMESGSRDAMPLIRVLFVEASNTKHARAVEEAVDEHDALTPFRTRIRRNEKSAEAYNHNQSVFDYYPKANAASDYRGVVDELIGAHQ